MAKSAGKFVLAVFLYLSFAIYLYLPFFTGFRRIQYLFVISASAASAGCYLLSRRWTASFFGSFFAGAIYGFSPFFLNLVNFHPTASVLAASIPWFFLPAAFGPKGKIRWVRAPLSLLPFLAVFVFFQAAEQFRLFAVPIRAGVNINDLVSILSPLAAAKKGFNLIGFYHIPIAALVIGLAMLIKARRMGTLLIIIAGLAGGFCNAIFGVSPIMWISIPCVCLAVIGGAGIDGLALAGSADRKWILASAVVMLIAAIMSLLLAVRFFQTFAGLGEGFANLFVQSARLYVLGSVAAGVIFILAGMQIRLTILRYVLLGCCMGVDIFFCAQYIVGRLFSNI